MRVLVSGSTGLVGRALVPELKAAGHTVVRLVHSPKATAEEEVQWDPQQGSIDAERLNGIDAAIHLAGENIFGRWTPEKKQRIEQSRVGGTRLLAETLAGLESKPQALIVASAVGYYGDRGEEVLADDAPPGAESRFLVRVCKEWEEAANPAREAGIRTAHTRFGVVLSTNGGALKTMLPPFRLGLGGPLGDGKQFMPWIAIPDVVGALIYALEHEDIAGPVNVTAPTPVTNVTFTQTLGEVIHRPTRLRLPAVALRTALGEMADEMLLVSERAVPRKLETSGYTFRYPALAGALEHLMAAKV